MAEKRSPILDFQFGATKELPRRSPLGNPASACYQTLLCPLTTDVVRRRFLSAIPELFWATARNKASTIISCAIRPAAFSPVMSDSSTLEQRSTSASCPIIHYPLFVTPIL